MKKQIRWKAMEGRNWFLSLKLEDDDGKVLDGVGGVIWPVMDGDYSYGYGGAVKFANHRDHNAEFGPGSLDYMKTIINKRIRQVRAELAGAR